MRLVWLLAIGLSVMSGAAAWAAKGDPLVVTANNVNVRAGPSTRDDVLFQVFRDEPAVELARKGRWVRVELPKRKRRGWIHDSLLAAVPRAAAPPQPKAEARQPAAAVETPAAQQQPAPPAQQQAALPAPQPAVTPPPVTPAGDALAQFRQNVKFLNDRALAVAGVDLFTDVRQIDPSTVQVVTTDAWSVIPESGQQSYANALLDRWRAAGAGGDQPTVQIVDGNGQVLMEKRGPS